MTFWRQSTTVLHSKINKYKLKYLWRFLLSFTFFFYGKNLSLYPPLALYNSVVSQKEWKRVDICETFTKSPACCVRNAWKVTMQQYLYCIQSYYEFYILINFKIGFLFWVFTRVELLFRNDAN